MLFREFYETFRSSYSVEIKWIASSDPCHLLLPLNKNFYPQDYLSLSWRRIQFWSSINYTYGVSCPIFLVGKSHCIKNEVFHQGFLQCICDQIHRKLRIWSHLLKKSLMDNFSFCAGSTLWMSNNGRITFEEKFLLFLEDLERRSRRFPF